MRVFTDSDVEAVHNLLLRHGYRVSHEAVLLIVYLLDERAAVRPAVRPAVRQPQRFGWGQ